LGELRRMGMAGSAHGLRAGGASDPSGAGTVASFRGLEDHGTRGAPGGRRDPRAPARDVAFTGSPGLPLSAGPIASRAPCDRDTYLVAFPGGPAGEPGRPGGRL